MSSPLLESSVDGATGILLNVTGPAGIGLFEVNEAAEVVTAAADPNANVIFGAVIDESLGDEVRVTVIATGFGTRRPRRQPRGALGDAHPRGGDGGRAARSRGRGDRDPLVPARRLVASIDTWRSTRCEACSSTRFPTATSESSTAPAAATTST